MYKTKTPKLHLPLALLPQGAALQAPGPGALSPKELRRIVADLIG